MHPRPAVDTSQSLPAVIVLLVTVLLASCGSAPQADPEGFAEAVERGEQLTQEIASIIVDGPEVGAEPVSYGFVCDQPDLGSEGAGIILEMAVESIDGDRLDRVAAHLRSDGFEVVVGGVAGEPESHHIHGSKGESTVDISVGSESVRIDFVTACHRTDSASSDPTTVESAMEPPAPSSPPGTQAPATDGDEVTAGPPPSLAPTLAPSRPSDLVIWGTRDAYTFEETQAFEEFGPVLWGLVTTLHGTDQIEHGPGFEWVIWGPLWGGSLQVAGPHDTFGVTDLAGVSDEAIAAVVPTGEAVVFREVRWSLDELNAFKDDLYAGAPGNGVCATGSGGYVNLVKVVATEDVNLGDVPQDAVAVEVVDVCPTYVNEPAIIEG